ncbi:hypothetical protein HDU76_003821 [Blyttiomyces sp. JEL0837]|nr:hypothetical protein HDU76_003821 [Blyttiomyces sp. JEL0837]
MDRKNATLFFGGSATPNPGTSGWGAVCFFGPTKDPKNEHFRVSGVIAGTEVTNNVAEYCALINGLRRLLRELHALSPSAFTLTIIGDSQLVIQQMKEVFSVKDPRLALYNAIAKGLVSKFGTVNFEHVGTQQDCRPAGPSKRQDSNERFKG